ncbi:MAG: T9SS type A sorting domain-containing protein [Sphingobacteriales bacterium]|nr:MAG: T9SS type A sorting domain-containing protein [Sphingobacteriales bacterium]
MRKLLLSFLVSTGLIQCASQSFAQCNATISNSGICYPVTLTVNANFTMDSISWKKDNMVVQTYVASLGSGFIVAGGNGQGNGANQLTQPMGMHVDNQGNIYVADGPNHRIQKWAPGATTGVTVAGGNGQGSTANQLSFPVGVFVDNNGDIYISDCFNNRVQKWAAGATSGVTVAGGNGAGSAANQLNFAGGLFFRNGSIYIVDAGNTRVQKWAAGATSGITVAGGNGFGAALNQLGTPSLNGNLYVDASENIFITEYSNHRVTKWAQGATAGVIVSGGNGQGSAANQLNSPTGIAVDNLGGIFVTDCNNHRVQYWPAGATIGTTVVGGNGNGTALNQVSQPTGFAKFEDTLYVCEYGNSRVTKFYSDSSVITNTYTLTQPGHYVAVITSDGGCVDSVDFDITVPNPVRITSLSERDLCEGSSLTLKVTPHDSLSYQWLRNGSAVGATADSLVITDAGTYTVISDINGGCIDTTTGITVTVRDLPEPLITNNNNVLSTGTYNAYQWQKGGVDISGANSSSYTATENGTYTVSVTNEFGCSGLSDPINLTGVGLEQVMAAYGLSLFPNPASGELYLQAKQAIKNAGIKIVNVLGQEVLAQQWMQVGANQSLKINVAGLNTGVYYLNITVEGKNASFKFTKL